MESVCVQREDGAHRYVVRVGDRQVGLIDYVELGDVLVMTHAEIDPGEQGKGLGAVLVGGALDDARSLGRRVVPRCPFVADFVARHREYDDLVLEG